MFKSEVDDTVGDFPGFPAETQAFLRELRANNTREWFAANKARFDEVVRAPAVEWVAAMGARLRDLDADIVADLRANGSGSLMRAARDTRFSKDKSPYKVNVAMMWWHGSGKKMQHPGFGMQITPDDAGLMVGMFHFAKPMLEAYRQAVLDDELGEALVETAKTVNAAGYNLSGLHYKNGAPRLRQGSSPRRMAALQQSACGHARHPAECHHFAATGRCLLRSFRCADADSPLARRRAGTLWRCISAPVASCRFVAALQNEGQLRGHLSTIISSNTFL